MLRKPWSVTHCRQQTLVKKYIIPDLQQQNIWIDCPSSKPSYEVHGWNEWSSTVLNVAFGQEDSKIAQLVHICPAPTRNVAPRSCTNENAIINSNSKHLGCKLSEIFQCILLVNCFHSSLNLRTQQMKYFENDHFFKNTKQQSSSSHFFQHWV